MNDAMYEFETKYGGPLVRLDTGHFAASDGTTLLLSSGLPLYQHPRTDAEREAMVGTYWRAVLDRADADRAALAAALAGEGEPWAWPHEIWVQKLYGAIPGVRPTRDGEALLSKISAVAAKAQIRLAKMAKAKREAEAAKVAAQRAAEEARLQEFLREEAEAAKEQARVAKELKKLRDSLPVTV